MTEPGRMPEIGEHLVQQATDILTHSSGYVPPIGQLEEVLRLALRHAYMKAAKVAECQHPLGFTDTGNWDEPCRCNIIIATALRKLAEGGA